MIKFINSLLILALFIAACNFSASSKTKIEDKSEKGTEMTKPAMIHTVFFWLNEGTTETQQKNFEQGLIDLGTCPQIQEYYWGPPAPTEARGVVDNSYSYAINVHFASLADQDAYQSEPIHLKFIEDHKDLWAKVIVYDNTVK